MTIYMYRPEKIRKIPRKENHTEFWKLFNMLLTPFKKTQGLFFLGRMEYTTPFQRQQRRSFRWKERKKKGIPEPSQRRTIPIATYFFSYS